MRHITSPCCIAETAALALHHHSQRWSADAIHDLIKILAMRTWDVRSQIQPHWPAVLAQMRTRTDRSLGTSLSKQNAEIWLESDLAHLNFS